MSISHPETKFYHAVNVAAGGDYFVVARWHGEHASWEETWQTIAATATLDPDQELAKLATHAAELWLREDPRFPAMLREIPHPPFGIYIKGNAAGIDGNAIAIVGTRKATDAGIAIAERLAASAASHRITVISGLAFGVDAAAHRGAVDAGGATIAVLACGLDRVYPEEHASLAARMLARGGMLISEYPPGAPTYPVRFLERNRIISGLSHGVIIIEAPVRSGALATARFATEQNREVFVVPGAITNKNYEGSLALLKQGAALITDFNDVLAAFPEWQTAISQSPPPSVFDDANEAHIFSIIQAASTPLSLDKIAELSKIELPIAARVLTALVIRGMVRENNGKYSLFN